VVAPAEKWALYFCHPHFHKLTGNLSSSLTDALGYNDTLLYIKQKHSLSTAALSHLNSTALKGALDSVSLFKRASIIKLIHGWAPTYANLCRQGHHPSPLCPRCSLSVETVDHARVCSSSMAVTHRVSLLNNFPQEILCLGTSPMILPTFEYKLSITLDIPNKTQTATSSTHSSIPTSILIAIHHQNLIGWVIFFLGYISQYWTIAYATLHDPLLSPPRVHWDCN
jgi:hypothetical protein